MSSKGSISCVGWERTFDWELSWNISLQFNVLGGWAPWKSVNENQSFFSALCTPFRNWISLRSTGGGVGRNNSLDICSASLFLTYDSCRTNKWFKIDPAEDIYFYCPLLRAFYFLTYMSVFEIETSVPFEKRVCCCCGMLSVLLWGELQPPGVSGMPSGNRGVELKRVLESVLSGFCFR